MNGKVTAIWLGVLTAEILEKCLLSVFCSLPWPYLQGANTGPNRCHVPACNTVCGTCLDENSFFYPFARSSQIISRLVTVKERGPRWDKRSKSRIQWQKRQFGRPLPGNKSRFPLAGPRFRTVLCPWAIVPRGQQRGTEREAKLKTDVLASGEHRGRIGRRADVPSGPRNQRGLIEGVSTERRGCSICPRVRKKTRTRNWRENEVKVNRFLSTAVHYGEYGP
jgi:hypothetical protein